RDDRWARSGRPAARPHRPPRCAGTAALAARRRCLGKPCRGGNIVRRIAIIGGGAWGTALALVAARAGAEVTLWARDPAIVAGINERHENAVYLPGIPLDRAIAATSELQVALGGADAALLVCTPEFRRGVLALANPRLPRSLPLLRCAKGIEAESFRTMS